jgi:ABC-type transporter Mla MlaB component
MATSKKNDLIGYDPLAWMEGNPDENKDHLAVNKDDIENKPEVQPLVHDEEILITDAYSDGSVENTEDGAILNITNEEKLVIDEIEGENDSTLVEEMAKDPTSVETESSIFDLDATLTIQNVVNLHEKLKQFMAAHDQFEINASDVASIDTATLQLLVSLKKEALKLQKEVTIIYPSPRFVESAQLLGLLDVLGVHEA